MSSSFIVWTMQRSGGTSLAHIIETLGGYPSVLHEPFNGNQIHGSIVRDSPDDSAEFDFYMKSLASIESKDPGRSFKHCYEVHALAFNDCLLDFARDTGRANIILQRTNNLERQISLSFAEATGAWSKVQLLEKLGADEANWIIPEIDIERMISHEKLCRKNEKEILEKAGTQEDSVVVLYESLYSGSFKQRCVEIDRVLDMLEVESTSSNSKTNEIKDTLMFQKQGGNGVYDRIPNISEAIAAYETEFGKPTERKLS